MVVVFFFKSTKSGGRNKCINKKYLVVREKKKEHEVLIEHISTELMIEDPITKALPPKQYRKHVDHIGLVNPFDI